MDYNKKEILKIFLILKLKEFGVLLGGLALFIINCFIGYYFLIRASIPLTNFYFDFFTIGVAVSFIELVLFFGIGNLIKANWKKAKEIYYEKDNLNKLGGQNG